MSSKAAAARLLRRAPAPKRGEAFLRLLDAQPLSASPQAAQSSLLEEALAGVREELQRVTDCLLGQLEEEVARKVVYIVAAGGKRLRPALVLLSAGAGGKQAHESLINAAAAVELIHTATLIHDDIIDQSPLRRAQPSFHSRWGTERAVLMGDYLYSTAFSLLSRIQSPYATQAVSDVCRQLARGELMEVDARFRLDLTEEQYTGIITDKTASLIGACCEIGSFLGGASQQAVENMRLFGVNFGLAFQIVDDCLDLTGNQAEMGKSVLADLDKGALSLPLIYLAQSLKPQARKRLFAPLKQQAGKTAFIRRVAKQAVAAGAVARAEARALAYVQASRQALDQAAPNGLYDACRMLAEYAVARRS